MPKSITTRQRIVMRILMLIARYLNDDPAFAEELKTLETHINVERFKEGS